METLSTTIQLHPVWVFSYLATMATVALIAQALRSRAELGR